MQDLTSLLHDAKIFSKVDLIKGYYQVPMDEADIPKTAIITPFGLFEFLFMPFDWQMQHKHFKDSWIPCFVPFLLFSSIWTISSFSASPALSKSRSQHLVHLEQILSILAENGLCINPEKCLFAQEEVTFLGHHVTTHGLVPLPSHVEPILALPPPADVKSLQHFLGMVNLYRCFLPGNAHVLAPLTSATKGKGCLTWTPFKIQNPLRPLQSL